MAPATVRVLSTTSPDFLKKLAAGLPVQMLSRQSRPYGSPGYRRMAMK